MTLPKIILALVLLMGSLGLAQYHINREFINLAPTEGIVNSVALSATSQYEQTFITSAPTLAQVGIWLRRARPDVPPGEVRVTIFRGAASLRTGTIASSFIDESGFSLVRFNPPLVTTPGETLRMVVAVPDQLSEALRLQIREPDPSFNAKDTTLTINEVVQPAPLAYQAFASYRPPVVIQLALVLVLAALYLVVPLPASYAVRIWLAVAALALPLLAALPALLAGQLPGWLIINLFIAASGMVILLAVAGSAPRGQLMGALAFTLGSWFTLQYVADRPRLLLLCLLPWLLIVSTTRWSLSRWQRATITIGIGAWLLIGFVVTPPLHVPLMSQVAHLKDIWLDPAQAVSSEKVVGASWDYFGSYVGVIALLLGILGLIRQGKKYIGLTMLCGVTLGLALVPAAAHVWVNWVRVPAALLIVIPTFGLAFFAGLGLDQLEKYLGRDHIAILITTLLVGLALFDLLVVNGRILDYSWL